MQNLHSQMKLNHQIFVNRTLNLKSIKVVGFDMDYTLVLYNQDEVEGFVFDSAISFLIEQFDYPERIRKLKFDPSKVIRGLVIDKKRGNLIKINRFGYVRTALHGDRFLSRDEVKEIYGDEFIRSSDARYDLVHTMFSMALGSLFSQLVELPELEHNYLQIFENLSSSLFVIHTQGELKQRIVEDPERFIIKDETYAQTLLMLKAFGKKVILITNSEWEFTAKVMEYSYGPYLKAEGLNWEDVFDLVIVEAAKPVFFNERRKFFEVMPENGYLKNLKGFIQEKGFYQGGNSRAVEKLFDVPSRSILYVGDHIFSDVYESKKSCLWRTMLVVTELEDELIASDKGQQTIEKIRDFMIEKEKLELELDQIEKQKVLNGSLGYEKADKKALKKLDSEIHAKISEIDREVSKRIVEHSSYFNPHWGELMWAGNDMSHFGMVLERYACVYTAKVSNLMYYSPAHYFRPHIKKRF